MKVLVTGSSGLIGSEAVVHFSRKGDTVFGFDNNLRKTFFGPDGDTTWSLDSLKREFPAFKSFDVDIRDRARVLTAISELAPDVIVHCAAQPSHDLAAKMPFEDFDTNAVGTHNLLEATRRHCPEAVFVFMSTNKVYGDAPNHIELTELPKRWDYKDPRYAKGIAETFTIDQSLHSLFGASKIAADVMVQEYGRYFGMKTGVFRGGCLTGVRHSGAELHGFLAYFFKAAAEGRRYRIFGYKGKQVRDQIHSADVVSLFDAFIANPRPGAVYNLGGGKGNSVSILECIDRVEQLSGHKFDYEYDEKNRIGDHICYYTDLTRVYADFPGWKLSRSIDAIFEEFARVAFSPSKGH